MGSEATDLDVSEQSPRVKRRWAGAAVQEASTAQDVAAPATADAVQEGRFFEHEIWAPPPTCALGEAFDMLQAFDGTIERVDGEDVTVVLRDITDPSNPDEEATLTVRQFDDASRVRPGAPFYLMIGYRERRSGRELVTVARLRTMVPLTAMQRARAATEGKAAFAMIGQKAPIE